MDSLIQALINEVTMHRDGQAWHDAPAALRLNLRQRLTAHLLATLDMAAKLDPHAPQIMALAHEPAASLMA